MEGTCIVITPLIALMKDQVQHLRAKGIKAAAIYSGMNRQEIVTTLENAIFGGTKLLYVSPERIASEIFKTKLRKIKVSFITVDEAHCISQWGYDFRPSYLHIADIRRLKPDAPVLALTATATPGVADDIQEQLQFAQKNVFRMSFERQNLAYIVRRTNDKEQELRHILQSVAGSAIVYVRSRKRAKEIAEMLTLHGIDATFYHAGLEHGTKSCRQDDWQNGATRVMVATNAFGMGIDKSNVRLVIHIDCPDSPEAYFQEAGRAGRDGQKAYAVLLYNDADERKLDKRIADTFPEKEYIKQVYEHVAFFFQVASGSGFGHTFAFDIDRFCRAFKHFPVRVNSALKILMRAGYLEYETDPDAAARVLFLLERNDLYLLRNLSPKEDALITTLLRLYGGLFTDYVYIDEDLIAQKADLTREEVYLLLKGLSRRHILHFVPQRKMPFISYMQRREETERVVLSPAIYEERKAQYTHRVHAMIAYAKYNDVCRSRQLLRYFREERSADCGQCDVCLSHVRMPQHEEQVETAKACIKKLLDDKEKHHITEVHTLGIPDKICHEALTFLSNEAEITASEGFISLSSSACSHD